MPFDTNMLIVFCRSFSCTAENPSVVCRNHSYRGTQTYVFRLIRSCTTFPLRTLGPLNMRCFSWKRSRFSRTINGSFKQRTSRKSSPHYIFLLLISLLHVLSSCYRFLVSSHLYQSLPVLFHPQCWQTT